MKLYARFLCMLFKSQMQYRASFVMLALGQFLVSFTAFLGIRFLFDRFHAVQGFSYEEILLCFSVVLMAFSLTECFVRGFDVFPSLIQSGGLDRFLLRPRGVVFQVLTSRMDFSRVGRLVQAVWMLAYAVDNSAMAWTADKAATLALMLAGGVAVFAALFVLYAGLSFLTIEGLEFVNIFTDGSREFGKYPLSIYGEGVLKFYTYVIPVALFQYYPLLYLTGRSDAAGLMFLPLLGFVFLLPCYGFFRWGLRRYQSTGS